MGYFEDGEWKPGWYPSDDKGRFVRPATTFRASLKAEDVEKGRYHLYVCYACPWAHRALIAREYLGLQDYFSVSVVDWYLDDDGWAFREREGATEDHLFGSSFLREVYLKSDARYSGRVTVPVLWDKKEQAIVNNESREILRLMSTVFAEAVGSRELSPKDKRDHIDEVLDAIYEPINNGVYKTGFAKSQEAYEEALDRLFQALEHWEGELATRDYLVGDSLTEADVAMFTTLIRFDPVYFVHFKCSKKRIVDFPNLSRYLQRLYDIPEIQATVNFTHIRHHYYESHRTINPFGVVAAPPERMVGYSDASD